MGKSEQMRNFLSFILLCVWLLFKPEDSLATVIKVTNTPNSIHNAIIKAGNGDTLLLQKGLYKEHDIIIQKRLVILGNDFPVIDAEHKYQVFIIMADDVVIQGLQIQNIGKVSMT